MLFLNIQRETLQYHVSGNVIKDVCNELKT